MGAKRGAASQSQQSPRPKGRPRKEASAQKESKETPKAKAPKVPKEVPKEPTPPPPPIPDWCLPVLGLLDVAPEIPQSCRAMISDVLRHSGLQKEVHGRHGYQESFLKDLSESFAKIQALRQEAVDAAEASIADHDIFKTKASSKVEAAKEKADGLRADRDAKHEAVLSAGKATQAAEAKKISALEHVTNHQADHEQSKVELEQFTKLVTTKFVPLKEFTFPGKHWRVREKAVHEFAGALSKAGMEDSLKDALLIAFKKRPTDSEKFASQAIEFAEKLVSKHLANLEASINNFDGESISRAAAAAAAVEALAAAKKYKDGATDDFIAADNLLLEATTAVDTAVAEEKMQGPKAAELAASLEVGKAQLTVVKSLVDSFETARAGSAGPG